MLLVSFWLFNPHNDIVTEAVIRFPDMETEAGRAPFTAV